MIGDALAVQAVPGPARNRGTTSSCTFRPGPSHTAPQSGSLILAVQVHPANGRMAAPDQLPVRNARASIRTPTEAAPARRRIAGAFLGGGAGRHHIVDDHDALALDVAAAAHAQRRRARCVPAPAVRAVLATASGGGAPASPRTDRRPAGGMHRLGQQRRLVVAPGERAGSNAAAPERAGRRPRSSRRRRGASSGRRRWRDGCGRRASTSARAGGCSCRSA